MNLSLLTVQPDPTMSMISTFGSLALIIVIFYFFILRPQQKKEKQSQQ
ncbi:MAG: preprotein translocase subunit YajC, partial [Angelakisella sp.]